MRLFNIKGPGKSFDIGGFHHVALRVFHLNVNERVGIREARRDMDVYLSASEVLAEIGFNPQVFDPISVLFNVDRLPRSAGH